MSRNRERRRDTQALSGFSREEVRELTRPLLREWQSSTELFDVRRRLRSVFAAGLVVVLGRFVLSPDGITGLLLTLWTLLSVPVMILVGCLLVLLRTPSEAADVWWEHSVPATIGLLTLAGLVRAGESSPGGRAAWELLIDDEHPAETEQFGESEIDRAAVGRIRRYVYYAIVGSVTVTGLDQATRTGLLSEGSSLGGVAASGPALVALLLGAVVVGAGVGFVIATVQG
ncbi:hypothetical protein GRX03_05270 [Halovenus sp. WSH3]|uniref:Uncharacterized protein n=1 Tax=Halovenus carboxidivorans TaxID=2692199 RepID=A0A6B0T4B4_9EURY|nr:hypothetical protein [Halovenus carboxidivorans]MXR51016.1 hypothetical protein [Halovenus carboxidivorans]